MNLGTPFRIWNLTQTPEICGKPFKILKYVPCEDELKDHTILLVCFVCNLNLKVFLLRSNAFANSNISTESEGKLFIIEYVAPKQISFIPVPGVLQVVDPPDS